MDVGVRVSVDEVELRLLRHTTESVAGHGCRPARRGRHAEAAAASDGELGSLSSADNIHPLRLNRVRAPSSYLLVTGKPTPPVLPSSVVFPAAECP